MKDKLINKKVIKEINQKEVWESSFEDRSEKTFLQSWNWGEVQKRIGNKIWRLGVYDNDKLLFPVLVIKIVTKRGAFLLVQHCLGMNDVLLEKLKEIAKKEKCAFIRLSCLLKNKKENITLFKNLGFRKAPFHANSYTSTLKLNIQNSLDQLLSNMRKTTRYLVRKSIKNKDLDTITSNKIEDLETYNYLTNLTANYKNFRPLPFELTKKEFEVFSEGKQAQIFFVRYNKKIIGGALIIFWSNIAFYHQAAFDPKYNKIPASYFLQWEIIKEAKKNGCKEYDFWGYVDYRKYPFHPWAGPTMFKEGFGGKVYEYLPTQDFPLTKAYWLGYLFDFFRSMRKGYNF